MLRRTYPVTLGTQLYNIQAITRPRSQEADWYLCTAVHAAPSSKRNLDCEAAPRDGVAVGHPRHWLIHCDDRYRGEHWQPVDVLRSRDRGDTA